MSKHDNFIKNRKTPTTLKTSRTGKWGRSKVNECWRPSNEASKADLKEFHREEMKLRKARRG